MTRLNLAKQFLDIFYSGKNLDDLYRLVTDNFSFYGPLYQYNSAQAYIEALKNDPPNDLHYFILQEYENQTSVCLIYQFSKPGIQLPMTQLFEFQEEKISKITLIFDPTEFRK